MFRYPHAILCALAALAAGCQSPPQNAGVPAGDSSAMAPVPAPDPVSPDTTGPALWSWLQKEAYRESWDL
jgi:hypothetical protein